MTSLKDFLDVSSTNLNANANKYVLTYDAPNDKFVFVNPDEVINSAVGISTTVTPNMAWWDGVTGHLTLQIPNHGFGTGHYIKIADNSLTFTCEQDSHATNHTYPRAGDFASDRWLPIFNVNANAFRVIANDTIPSNNTGIHTFVSAVANSVYHTSDPTPVGLSTASLDYLDDYLDHKIDLDAGGF